MILGPSFVSSPQNTNITNPDQTLNDTEQEIVKILEEYVKPAVASDGGNIIFDSYEDTDKRVKVLLQGACSGCLLYLYPQKWHRKHLKRNASR